MWPFLPLIVCVVGLLAWVLAGNAIVKDAGRIAFAVGLFVTVALLATNRMHLP
jgi:hypothetical protein